MDMEHTLLAIVLMGIGWATIIMVSGGGVLVMMVIATVRGNMIIEVDMRRQRMDSGPVVLINFMRVRLRCARRAGPHKRGSQNGRKELTHQGHLIRDYTTRYYCGKFL